MTAPIGGRVDVEDLSLHVEQVRDGDGGALEPALVLVHGIAGSTADWHEVVGELASRRRVLAYDQRGHGRSGWADDHASYTFDRLVRDLDVVVSSTGAGPVDLVGHSMGGVVALRFALERPGRVRSLVLVDTAAAPAHASHGLAKLAVGALLRVSGAVASAVRAARHSRRGREADPTPAVDGNLRELQAAAFAGMDPAAVSALGRELGSYPSLVGHLGRVACPTTVVVGERDTGLLRSARTLAAGIPGARLAVVAGGDHSPQSSRPQAWLQAVERHLDRVDGGDQFG